MPSTREGRAPERHVCQEKDKACFAKYRDLEGLMRCKILTETYPPGACPFCKPQIDVTNGVWYPYDPNYGKAVKPGKEKEVPA